MVFSWQFFAFGSAIFAAFTAIFGKLGVMEMNSNLATFFRTIIILIISAVFITVRSEWVKPENVSTKSIIFLVLSGIATGASWLCYYRALQMAPASRVAPIDKLSVVLVVIFAIIFLGEKLTWKVGIGALLVGLGATVMAF